MNAKGILIVEDESIVALDMRMRLESMGYRVVDVVDTGALALERAVSAKPDLILLDIKLKGPLDGIETARAIREIAPIPVIFVTAFADEKTLQRAKLTSAYGYIIKPYHERELRVAIELALYKHEYELSVVRAKELAEEANRLKGEFLANISHELKTPLNSVIGFAQLALERALDEEQRENLGLALGAAHSLRGLIDSILQFTKMEAGRLAPVSLPFSLDALIGECVDILALSASRKGLGSSFRKGAGLPDLVVGDEALLKRIILNLIDNATKFTDSGRVRLELDFDDGHAPGEDPEGSVAISISVADTGIGMPADKIESAFERFTQLDGSTTRKIGGTGLGLAIVRKSLESIGGRIVVDSSPGRGTRIRACLSLALPEAGRPELRPRFLEAKTLVITGFADEEAGDVAELASSLGASCLRARDLGEAVGVPGSPLVICDEGALALGGETEDETRAQGLPGGLEHRLIVAFRFGSHCRARLGFPEAVSFTSLPLRADRLAASVLSLSQPQSATPPPARGRQAGRDLEKGLEGLLLDFALVLETAGRTGSAHEAELMAKELSQVFAREGFGEGERLAFSALLAARKGEAKGLGLFAARARELAAGPGPRPSGLRT